MDNQPRQCSVLFLKERNGWWVALWLETNIAAQERNIRAAWQALQRTVQGQLILDRRRGREELSAKNRAPDWYWDAYASAKPLSLSVLTDLRFDDGLVAAPRQIAA